MCDPLELNGDGQIIFPLSFSAEWRQESQALRQLNISELIRICNFISAANHQANFELVPNLESFQTEKSNATNE